MGHENNDGTMTNDQPLVVPQSQSRARRKRPRSVLDEFGSATDLAEQPPDEEEEPMHITTTTKRKKLKRRRKESTGSGLLHSISSGGNTPSTASRSTSLRRKKGKISTRKNKVRKRRKSQVQLSDEEYNEMDDFEEEQFHDSDQYMN